MAVIVAVVLVEDDGEKDDKEDNKYDNKDNEEFIDMV